MARKRFFRPYTANHGKPGVVYVLSNNLLKAGLYKIGQSTRSGHARARDLNADASTAMPANYRCVFECKTVDCGRAEEAIHLRLARYRKGKKGQEFFEASLDQIKEVIVAECKRFDQASTAHESRAVFEPILRIPKNRGSSSLSHENIGELGSSINLSAGTKLSERSPDTQSNAMDSRLIRSARPHDASEEAEDIFNILRSLGYFLLACIPVIYLVKACSR